MQSKRRLRVRAIPTTMVCAALLVLAAIPTTWATLNDNVTMSQVAVTAGTVQPPTALSATETPTAAQVTYTAPASGITPDGYDVFRSTTSGSYGPTPIGSSATTTYNDTTAVECTPYFYKARSTRVLLDSVLSTTEASITLDRTAPTLGAEGAHVYFDPTPRPKVADYVRVTPGGNVEVYAKVTDNCDPTGAGLAVNFTFGAPFNSTVAATYGSYQPVSGGPTYNYMWGPYALPASSLANGATMNWTVDATDADGNTASLPGTVLTGDGVGPTFNASTPAEIVSATTNYYDSTLGRGEIVSSSSTNTTVKNAGYYLYANITDPSGVDTVVGDAATITSTATAANLVSGSYTTDNGVSWGYRSAALVPNVAIANGQTRSATITATDDLGNVSTNAPNVLIDITPITAVTCANTGNASNTLNVGDLTTWTFGTDTVDPASIKSTFVGGVSSFSGTASITNGTRDFFNLNTNLGLTMFAGTAYNQSWNLNATNWTVANFTSSTISVPTYNTVRLAYGTPSASVADRNSSAISYISTNVRNAAGLPVASTITTAGCSTSAW